MTSSAESTRDTQADKLRMEAAERVTESIPPTLGLNRLIAIDHTNKMLAAARRRVEDSHTAQMLKLKETMGVDFPNATDTEDDEVAIHVAGDTNHFANPPTKQTGGAMKLLAGVLAGSALPIAGAVAYELLTDRETEPPPAVQQPVVIDRDTYLPYEFGIK